MNLLPKLLWKEEYNYYSDRSVNELRNDIQLLFNETDSQAASVNLTGEFISDTEFRMTPKRQFLVIRNYEHETSYLDGQILLNELDKTQVTFTVRPNSIFAIFFFLFPVLGLLSLLFVNKGQPDRQSQFISLVFIVIAPVMMLGQSYYFKQSIRNRFIKKFNLKPIA